MKKIIDEELSDIDIDISDKHNVNVETMNNFQLSRWAALVEGINIISEKADDKRQKFERVNLKPLALKKYVDGVCDNICRVMNREDLVKESRETIKEINEKR